jgi:hypothetical protein
LLLFKFIYHLIHLNTINMKKHYFFQTIATISGYLSGLFKNLLTALILVCFGMVGASGQGGKPAGANKVMVSNLFQPLAAHSQNLVLDEMGRGIVLQRLNTDALKGILADKHTTFLLEVPVPGGKKVVVDLAQNTVLTDGFFAGIFEGDNQMNVEYKPGIYYQGMVQGVGKSLVTFSFFENMMMGFISLPDGGNIVIGSLKDDNGNPTFEYVIYDDAELLIQSGLQCFTEDGPLNEIFEGIEPGQPEGQNTKCVKVYFECDYKMYTDKGSNVNNVLNYVTGLFNQVIAVYNLESVTTLISNIMVWTTTDPFASYTTTADYLPAFRSYRTSFVGDLAHALTTRSIGGGRAYLNVLCSSTSRYAVSGIYNSYSNFPTYSWTIMVVSHEMGHNLGSNHTHWCGWAGGPIDNCGPSAGYPNEGGSCANGPLPVGGGTVMSYCHLTSSGINLSKGFGPLPGDLIRTKVNNASCINCICTPSVTITSTPLCTGSAVTYTASFQYGGTATVFQWKKNGVNVGTNSVTYVESAPSNGDVQVVLTTNAACASGTTYSSNIITTSCCVSPSLQASNIEAGSITATSITANWTNGNGTRRLVYINTSDVFVSPGNGTDPTAISVYNGTGQQCVYNGSGNSVTVTGLIMNSTYWFRVYEANCSGINTVYNSMAATGNPVSVSTNGNGLNCTSAVLLTCGQSYNGSTAGGQSNESSYSCASGDQSGPEIVHIITTSSAGALTASLINAAPGLNVTILSSCDASACIASGLSSAAVSNAPAGTYYIVVDGNSGASGSYTIAVNCVPHCPPATPSNPTSNSPQCNSVTLTRSGSPGTNEIGYWQSTTCGMSTALGSGATFTASSSGTYYLRAYNTIGNCWSSGCGSVTVTVNKVPAVPSAITGNTSVCKQSTQNYSCTAVAGATSYNWKVPGGAKILAGQGSTTIAVKFGKNGGNMQVQAVSSCGNSAYKALAVATVNCARMGEPEFAEITHFEVFPNPANDKITFELPDFEGIGEVFVYNVNAQMVVHQSINCSESATHSLPVSKLSPGIYHIMVIGESGRAATRFVKE